VGLRSLLIAQEERAVMVAVVPNPVRKLRRESIIVNN
jgi:hypothetical protein